MKLANRFVYLLYYLKETNFSDINRYAEYASSKTHQSLIKIYADALYSIFKYNVSLKDYFCFRFFNLDNYQRCDWAGTGFMYEFQLKMNPKKYRSKLEDKLQFLHYFRQFVHRNFYSFQEINSNRNLITNLLKNESGKLVLKGSHGQIGAEVEIIDCNKFSPDLLINYMKKNHYDLIEDYVIQHPALMDLSPSGLNTVRMFTQIHNGNVEFLGARLRISVNSPVDNMAAGNLAAPVNMTTGLVDGPGVYSDITKEEQTIHPVTGALIVGFKIPYWDEVKLLTRQVALKITENKSVGWDIAITKSGPELIEGNHNWCKLLWQLPVKSGLKKELEKYLS